MKLLVINGPNLNFLGVREPSIYGAESYDQLIMRLKEKAKQEEFQLELFQSNIEGELIDRIQKAYSDETEGLIINPGAYAHYSLAIRDALKILSIPMIEVHISNVYQREEFRHTSVISAVCTGAIVGMGTDGYFLAIDAIKNILGRKKQ